MPRFAYKGIDTEGNEAFGIVEAEDETGALGEIQRLGLYVTNVRPAHIHDEWRLRWVEERKGKKTDEERKQREVRQRHTRQRLVVRYADGHTEYGMCFALNPHDSGFHLDLADAEGVSLNQTKAVRFSELKAVFYVKTFDGKFDKNQRYQDWEPEGEECVVVFRDGETLRGRSLHRYDPDERRFYLIPHDAKTNNLCVLVERAAAEGVYSTKEYASRQAAASEERRKGGDAATALSQEETLGDFYFETRNYPAALEQYTTALKRDPLSKRLRKKMLFATYNNGIQHIKRHEYPEALACMETVLKSDPQNHHALKKAAQLRRIMQKEGKSGPDDQPSGGRREN